ncbi:hypothetical protein XENTR_v10018160 [Xenopus tropicalis]|nr:hypothetical protein XENTR_v10018160 [Xenopus tropicalis]
MDCPSKWLDAQEVYMPSICIQRDTHMKQQLQEMVFESYKGALTEENIILSSYGFHTQCYLHDFPCGVKQGPSTPTIFHNMWPLEGKVQ